MSLNFSHICQLCLERDDILVTLFEKGRYLLFRIKTLAPKLKILYFTHFSCILRHVKLKRDRDSSPYRVQNKSSFEPYQFWLI